MSASERRTKKRKYASVKSQLFLRAARSDESPPHRRRIAAAVAAAVTVVVVVRRCRRKRTVIARANERTRAPPTTTTIMPAVQRLLTFIVAAAIVIATTSAQILSPIVPMNHPYGGVGGGGSGGGGNGDFAPLGGYGAPVRPSYIGNGALFAAQPPPQQQPAFATLGASSSPYAAIGVGGDVFGSSFAGTGSASDGGGDWPSPDYGAYRQNAALLQKASYGGGGLDGLQSLGGGGNMDARSPPHSSFGASSFGASSATPLRRAAMPPIQVRNKLAAACRRQRL